MVKLISHSNELFVFHKKLHIFHSTSASSKVEIIQQVSLGKVDVYSVFIDVLEFSPCGQFIAATVHKKLLILSALDFKLLHSCQIEKTSSCIRFFNCSKCLLVGDRSGHVTVFSYENGLTKLDTALGHISQITDVLISPLDNYIITADRDEKIRVTCYPNVYNIQSYCLGHEQFVSSLCFAPNNINHVVSASGDSSLRLWNYTTGVELAVYRNHLTAPYVKVISGNVSGDSLLFALHYLSVCVEILYIEKISDCKLNFILKTTLKAPGNVIDIAMCNSALFGLCENEKTPFCGWPDDNVVKLNEVAEIALKEEDLQCEKKCEMLFKRDFDNVGEYYKKKKARLLLKYH